jgi:hypothetical protein
LGFWVRGPGFGILDFEKPGPGRIPLRQGYAGQGPALHSNRGGRG